MNLISFPRAINTQNYVTSLDTIKQKQAGFEFYTNKSTLNNAQENIQTCDILTNLNASVTEQKTNKKIQKTTNYTQNNVIKSKYLRNDLISKMKLVFGQRNSQLRSDVILTKTNILQSKNIDTCKNSVKLTKEELRMTVNGNMPILKTILMEYLPILTVDNIPLKMPVTDKDHNTDGNPLGTATNNLPKTVKLHYHGLVFGTISKQITITNLQIQEILSPTIYTINSPVNYNKTGLSPPGTTNFSSLYATISYVSNSFPQSYSSKLTVSLKATVSLKPTVSSKQSSSLSSIKESSNINNNINLLFNISIHQSGFFCLYTQNQPNFIQGGIS